jgi:peptidyl-prolyl cis-trans isomerase SurA
MPAMNRILLYLALTLAAAPAWAKDLPAAGVLLDSYAALVNGKVITIGEVLSALQPIQEELMARYEGDKLQQKLVEEFDSVRDALVDSELILLDFAMQGGALPDRAIEDHVNTVVHERFGNDRTAFLRALADQRLTVAEWRKQMKEQLTVQMMRQKEVSAKILIAPLDLQRVYDAKKQTDYSVPESVRLRTLSLDPGDTATETEAARSRAAEIRARIQSGETTFERAATDGATLHDDGELLEVASLDEAIRTALVGLAPDDVSAPLEIGDSLYLVQLVERRAAGTRPFEEVAPEIARELRRSEFERLNRAWIDSLRAKYHVQLFSHNLFD